MKKTDGDKIDLDKPIKAYMAKPDKTLGEHYEDFLRQAEILWNLGYISSEHMYDLLKDCGCHHDDGKVNLPFQMRVNDKSGKIKFDEEKEVSNVLVNGLSMDSELTKEEFDTKQHFTQPPAHYTEATLVKALEELGIGRPSTYAPTISTILGRRYITKEAKNLYITEIGEVVNNIMKQSFPSIVDVNFTANMEGLLDMVEEGKVQWKVVVSNFYPDLDEAVKTAEKELESVKIEDEVTDVICEECGRNMVIKYGPHGKFLACPGFPDCRNTKPYLEKIGVACPVCGKEVVIRKTKKGRKYYGCENNPECDFMSWQKPSKEKCPECGGYMVEKGNKLVCANEQCGYVRNLKGN